MLVSFFFFWCAPSHDDKYIFFRSFYTYPGFDFDLVKVRCYFVCTFFFRLAIFAACIYAFWRKLGVYWYLGTISGWSVFDLFVSGARTQTQPESAIKIDGHMYELVHMERLCFCRMLYSVYFCVSFHFFFFFILAEACFDSRCEVQNSWDRWDVGGKFSCLYARFAGAYLWICIHFLWMIVFLCIEKLTRTYKYEKRDLFLCSFFSFLFSSFFFLLFLLLLLLFVGVVVVVGVSCCLRIVLVVR